MSASMSVNQQRLSSSIKRKLRNIDVPNDTPVVGYLEQGNVDKIIECYHTIKLT
uniref:Uncharacterized protein n=1 Tax=Rhodnius prolixus TaxID=13249 RepID=T1H9G3_RHOPR